MKFLYAPLFAPDTLGTMTAGKREKKDRERKKNGERRKVEGERKKDGRSSNVETYLSRSKEFSLENNLSERMQSHSGKKKKRKGRCAWEYGKAKSGI